jgi:L-ribulose-5-phosphate 3-epimerase
MGFAGVAFNTANLVGQVTNWRFQLARWMDQHRATVAATDERAWAAIVRRIAADGWQAAEIWQAHADPEVMTRDKAKVWRAILEDHGVRPVAYAGGFSNGTVNVCEWLGIPQVNGGLAGLKPDEATALARSSGIRFNFENHSEKSWEEHLDRVAGGNEWLGCCVDTGWYGTQGVDAAEAVRRLGSRVRHVHLKDVKAKGRHETCPLGEGIVGPADVLAALKEIGYAGWISWEDEPEDRNPWDVSPRMREWIEARV